MTITPMTTQNLDMMATAAVYPMVDEDPAAQMLEGLRNEVCDLMYTSLGISALYTLVRFVARDFKSYRGDRSNEEAILRQIAGATDAKGRNPWIGRLETTLSAVRLHTLSLRDEDPGEVSCVFMDDMHRFFGLYGAEVALNYASRDSVRPAEWVTPEHLDAVCVEMAHMPRTEVLHWFEMASMDATEMKGIF